MNRFLASIALVTGCSSPFADPDAQDAADATPTFDGSGAPAAVHVVGDQIVDTAGQPIHLVGWNDTSLETEASSFISQAPADMSLWGFNSVRVIFPWQFVEPTAPGVRDEVFVAKIEHAIHSYTDRGIYVIVSPMQQHFWSDIDWKSQPGSRGQGFPHWCYPDGTSMTMDQARDAFFLNRIDVDGTSIQEHLAAYEAFIASLVADNPLVIGMDLFNEPYAYTITAPEQNLDGLYDTLAKAVRASNPSLILFCEDSQYRAERGYSMTRMPAAANAVYSHHLYSLAWDTSPLPGAPTGKDVTDAFQSRGASWGVPVWNGEFIGFDYIDTGDPIDRDSFTRMMSALETRGEHWSYYAYVGHPGGLTTDGGTIPRTAYTVAILQSGI
jgi:hypothetical protein